MSAMSTTTAAKNNQVEVFIDGQSVRVPVGAALIQACEKTGAVIPRFCYHERLMVAGNCRMCLVEVEKVPKPVASCAYPVTPGMRVHTSTPMVHKAREGVMEFLLSNHPLDCPICDQGGECDLQDQSVRYGSDRGRFREIEGKRAVEDKDFGPLVKTTMTRCIHCTRCVRFANEIAGAEELGTSGRGNDMQIGTYIEKVIDSEMSANIIDLCPVGALTSKPYEFKSRPWELKKTESIDVMDALASNIRVDSRGVEVMRILPRVNDEINEEWINDKTRFACDGLKRQRLTAPLIKLDGQFQQVSWKDALARLVTEIRNTPPSQMTAIAGQLADVESLVAMKDWMLGLGSQNLRLDGGFLKRAPVHGVDWRASYVLNTGLMNVEHADAILLIGTNPRHEAAGFNVRLRKRWLSYGCDFGLIGENVALTYDYDHLGHDLAALSKLENTRFFKKLSAAKNPMIIVGSGAVEHEHADQMFAQLAKLVKKVPQLLTPEWNGINVLQRHASMTGALDIGFVPGPKATPLEESKLVYLLNADQITRADLPSDAFVVYQGHHGDHGAHLADLILPGAAYTEKSATYVNTEGRAQMTRQAVTPPGAAREDWKIIRALSEVMGHALPYDDHYSLHERMAEYAPHLTRLGAREPTLQPHQSLDYLASASFSSSSSSGKTAASSGALKAVIEDFYMTDPISRASVTMAKCSKAFNKGRHENTGLPPPSSPSLGDDTSPQVQASG